ncbi:tubulin folding cofactor B [Capsaspora owczarzaki ATCC 30864]|uniref:Tubulin folding cofactor B n=1 Tax=Capsaspora owczarzaki (strain ATCC 30864) TaxID=595528 RepID=A0A0D2X5V2_CAPO3|nr:tubulin folding cofactor B [Capsaspora owczarzaki ATCC 30864]KJE98454.1 tubulin folding cofactor B [Capsaspora owczarzaki ATCC 30864]|eukprot:XP_004339904.1 tubulin folding cofactor B [Capsaspora owczarzaki ATCC 30864]
MSTINLFVTSSLSSQAIARQARFDKALTIRQLKVKLEMMVGSSNSKMQLQLFDPRDKLAGDMADDDAMLGAYPAEDNWRIHVVDLDPSKRVGEFEDLSQVEKFELNEEQYDQRADTVRSFKRNNKLGRFADDAKDPNDEGKEEAAAITVGQRCEVTVDASMAKRGVVRFVGRTQFKPGYWVGVQYDEPLGKNNGSVDGVKYFVCPQSYGAFVRPSYVRVGDYPEVDLASDLDEM